MDKDGSFPGRAATGTIAGHEYVDLGLSVKWATCNVGASSPEEYGDYYAGGETSTKSSYDEDNCATWNKSIGDIKGTSRDVARVKWGSPWRMPTDAEFDELLDSKNCTWTWTTQGGHKGYKVTSKKNGNSIFLPAAGCRGGTSLRGAGTWGDYWSSTPYESDTQNAYYLYFLYFDSSGRTTIWYRRNYGRTVRPVAELSLGDDVETHRRLPAGNDDNASPPLGTPAASPQSAKVKGTIAGHEYVDLGLSVMWATCNVGAGSPEDDGGYYAWGETKSYYYGDDRETLGKSIGDIKGTSRDVTHIQWGGSWRMPTKAEFEELMNKDNCTWTWTTRNGKGGYKVTSRKNGNSIFLPSTEYRDSNGGPGPEELYMLLENGGGYYWSSTPYESDTRGAYRLSFSSHGCRMTAVTRDDGYQVRPVSSSDYDRTVYDADYLRTNTIAGHDYVDLGLSVKWATCNVGASSPGVHGDHYAWGETSTKSSYFKDNCETRENDIGDIKGTLRDVARVKWGSPWRMPTVAEFDELLDSDNCTWTWTTQGGNEGYKVTSRKNGNSIFLPAAVRRNGMLHAGNGLYWSATSDESDPQSAYSLSIDSSCHGMGWDDRDGGHTVRPVAESGRAATGIIVGHEYVDLGLSVKWATCNVGASSPEEYGNYYAWGETETSYDEDSCETYGKDIGDIGGTSRDVAHVKWGGSWRMPTKAEFDELLDSDNCTWTWTTQGGHEGYKVTSRKNGNSIFLPAAGVRNETSLGDAGKYGHYWSSTPYWGGAQIAYSLYFGWSDHGTCPNYRDYWRTIRPVAESVRAAKGTINGHAYVDLGLSVKWATCNVGADSPGAYGNYYAWGETKTKSSYGEDNCETYGKDIGDIKGTSRDVARVKWGGSWRMPTKAEFEELLNTANCTWTWITEGGHRGYKVTSKKNGNSIFLPAAGYRYGTPASIGSYYYGMSLHDAGQHGDYWSSTPHGSDPQGAYKLSFGSSNRYTFWECRNGGLTIRPVTE